MDEQKTEVRVRARKNRINLETNIEENANRIIHVILYARVSTEGQDDNTSLDNQLSQCREYAQKNNLEVVLEIEEHYTGKAVSRPELTKAMMILREGKADGMVCLTVDRLARKVHVFSTLIEEFKVMKKQLHFVDSGLVNPDDFESHLVTIVKSLISEAEVNKILKRMREGKEARLKEGVPLMAKPPFGYKKIKVTDNDGVLRSVIEVNEDEAKVVRQMFLWAAHGFNGGEPLSSMQITRELNKLDISSVRKHGFAQSSVVRMLRNTFYAGIYYYGRTKLLGEIEGSKKRINVEDPNKWIKIELPRELILVDADTFNLAGERLTHNQTQAIKPKKHLYLLSGRHFVCGCCQRSMIGATAGRKSHLRRYQCASRNYAKSGQFDRDGNPKFMCARAYRTVSAPQVEYLVWEWLKWLATDENNLQKNTELVRKRAELELAPKKQKLEATETLIEKAKAKIDRLRLNIEDETDTEEKAHQKARLADTKTLLQNLQNQKNEITKEINKQLVTEDNLHQLWVLSSEIRRQVTSPNVSFDNMRFLLNIFEVKVTLHIKDLEAGKVERWLKIECAITDKDKASWVNLDDNDNQSDDGGNPFSPVSDNDMHQQTVHRNGSRPLPFGGLRDVPPAAPPGQRDRQPLRAALRCGHSALHLRHSPQQGQEPRRRHPVLLRHGLHLRRHHRHLPPYHPERARAPGQ
jgi:site-specific DNA recombinase